MCCRLRLDTSKLEKRGGLFTANPLTGSIGVVTLNMARIGYLSKSEEEFLDRVARQMEVAKESLVTKRALLERLTDADLYPYSRFYLRDIKSRFGKYWKDHFSTIGLVRPVQNWNEGKREEFEDRREFAVPLAAR